MQISYQSLQEQAFWKEAGVRLPEYDIPSTNQRTRDQPIWLHFGAGNIFRGYVASLQQCLLNGGLSDSGIIAAEAFDGEIIENMLLPHDCLTLHATLNADATVDCELIASVSEAVRADTSDGLSRLGQIATQKSLQIISFTITEKGYAVYGPDGKAQKGAQADIESGPDSAKHAMALAAGILLKRYHAGGHPVSLVSLDNCSYNGDKLKEGVLFFAEGWAQRGFAPEGFVAWVKNPANVGFPLSMIDKITPRPAEDVAEMLAKKGIEGIAPIVTAKGTYTAAFVNAERPQYLVLEDAFPNGRPPLEKAGVILTGRDTVNQCERMKVTTCLNPLHTAMSLYGCLLGYTRIYEEMRDDEIVSLIRRLGYDEGLPVVTDPGVLSPKAFIDEVVGERLPNPFMPDAPQRIATDTSQKMGIRFGETIKSHMERGTDLTTLTAIALSIAGWFRYLLAVDDQGNAMQVSPDPLLEDLTAKLSGIRFDNPASYKGELAKLLSGTGILGVDITGTPLFPVVEGMFIKMLGGPGAVRRTLAESLAR